MGVQIAKGYFGTFVAEVSSTGLTQVAWTRFITDTRILHLWVLSARGPEEFLIRALQYVSLENTMISFGHLSNGAAGVAVGTLRSLASDSLASSIAYNTTRVKNILKAEHKIIALSAYCGKVGKEKCLELLAKMRGGYSESHVLSLPILKDHPYRAQFTKQRKVAINNLFADHTARRYAGSFQQKIHAETISKTALATKLTIKSVNPITLGSFVGWTVFGFASVRVIMIGGLILFQYAERKRYHRVTQDFIDIESSEEGLDK